MERLGASKRLAVIGTMALATAVGAPWTDTGAAFASEDDGQSMMLQAMAAPGTEAMLNPQPLPPRSFQASGANEFADVMLNPQPLPPRSIRALGIGR